MHIDTLITLFKRDLKKLITEVESYKDESKLWVVSDDVSNSAGTLCLHLVGNLNHFIGAILGNTGYIRQRDQEFSLRNVPKAHMMSQVEDTIVMIEATFKTLSSDDLENNYPLEVFGKPMTTNYFLTHLVMHLSYHLGQINYHRRLLDK